MFEDYEVMWCVKRGRLSPDALHCHRSLPDHAHYYDIDQKYLGLLSEIPTETFLVAAEIVDRFKARVADELNPNLMLTLADHIQFAMRPYGAHVLRSGLPPLRAVFYYEF